MAQMTEEWHHAASDNPREEADPAKPTSETRGNGGRRRDQSRQQQRVRRQDCAEKAKEASRTRSSSTATENERFGTSWERNRLPTAARSKKRVV
jgi:hypothetical protein